MTLPKKPPVVKEAELDAEQTKIQRANLLGTPSKISGYTLENVPGPQQHLVTAYWYEPAPGGYTYRTYNQEVYPGKGRDMVPWYHASNPTGDPNFLPKVWVTRDPHRGTRDALVSAEQQRASSIAQMDDRLKGDFAMSASWQRPGRDRDAGAGRSRAGTILTSGRGITSGVPLLIAGGRKKL